MTVYLAQARNALYFAIFVIGFIAVPLIFNVA